MIIRPVYLEFKNIFLYLNPLVKLDSSILIIENERYFYKLISINLINLPIFSLNNI
jgi:hypothetical protein